MDSQNRRTSWVQSPSSRTLTRTKKRSKQSPFMKKAKSTGAFMAGLVLPFGDGGNNNESEEESKTVPSLLRQSSKSLLDSCKTAETFQSVETFHTESSMMMMMDKYAFMSYRFPVTTETKKLVFRKQPSKNRDIVIESTGGDVIGSIDYSLSKERGIRILKDTTGKHCAIIRKTQDNPFLGGNFIFEVYGDKPSTFAQEPSSDEVVNGCYLWAKIKNKGSIMGGKFVMKRYSSETSCSSDDRHYAKPFGTLFSKDKSKGYNITDSEEKQCAKMVSLEKNRNKGIVIGPNSDMCLMLAFSAVVDEMVENLLM